MEEALLKARATDSPQGEESPQAQHKRCSIARGAPVSAAVLSGGRRARCEHWTPAPSAQLAGYSERPAASCPSPHRARPLPATWPHAAPGAGSCQEEGGRSRGPSATPRDRRSLQSCASVGADALWLLSKGSLGSCAFPFAHAALAMHECTDLLSWGPASRRPGSRRDAARASALRARSKRSIAEILLSIDS